MKSHVVAQYDGTSSSAFFERIQRLAALQVDYIQLRAPALFDRAVYEAGMRCRGLIGSPTRFLINRRYDIAMSCSADGVHLPGPGLPASAIRSAAKKMLIGRSCHSLSDCRAAVAEDLDYVLLGPVFDTRSKKASARVSISELAEASALEIEVFAIGGVSRDNLQALKETGIAGVAAITMFMHDEPLEQIVEEVRTL
ncbi:MAG TPA: thiamine phosphate synthase [Thermoanaerobaculia bacterium]|nr:thiamine phosphate synthase [Thermoanaerobaculia bacterium]